MKDLINTIKAVSERRTWKKPMKEPDISKVRYNTRYRVYKICSIRSMFV